VHIFDCLYDFFDKTLITTKELHDMFAYAFSDVAVGLIPDSVDRVDAGDMLRSRISNVKVLFALGANEGSFPPSKHMSILTDDERFKAKANGVHLNDTAEFLRAKGNLYLYSVLCKPSEKLYVTRCLVDSGGEEQHASTILNRIQALFPDSIKEYPDHTTYGMKANQKGLLLLADYLKESTDKVASFEDLIEHIKRDEDLTEQYEMMVKGMSFDNSQVIFDRETYQSGLSKPLVTSVGRLEKYSSCPFAYFLNYMIKPQKRREPKIEKTDIGTLIHGVINEFSSMIISGDIKIDELDESTIRRITVALCEKALSEDEQWLKLKAYLKRRIMRSTFLSAVEIVKQLRESAYELTKSEAAFRFREVYTPLVLKVEDQQVYVQGIIDRIDRFIEKVRVIDYKSGSGSFDIAKVYHGLSLQLMLYLSAVTVNEHGSVGDGIFNLRLIPNLIKLTKETDDEKIRMELAQKNFKLSGITVNPGDGLSEEEFNLLKVNTEKRALVLASGIENGEIPISPASYNGVLSCKFCDFKGICMYDTHFAANKVRRFEKLRKDQVVERLKGR
jgi:ATP-dependent helicase/nuclease subunit B